MHDLMDGGCILSVCGDVNRHGFQPGYLWLKDNPAGFMFLVYTSWRLDVAGMFEAYHERK